MPDPLQRPGQLIEDLLKERGWDRQVLATVMGISNAGVTRLLSGQKRIDAPTALSLAEALGVEPERLLNLQQSYDLEIARMTRAPDDDRGTRADLFQQLPIREMAIRGWITVPNLRDVARLEGELMRFFGVESIDEIKSIPYAAKRTNLAEPTTPTQLAWIRRVKQVASGVAAPPYSRTGALKAIEKLGSLLFSEQEVRNASRILYEAGIRLVVVEALKASKIDGVCCWLNEKSPVVGISLRYDRIDNFWFVLRHEIEHVLRHHGKDGAFLDCELEGERAGVGQSVLDEERMANAAAADFCVPTTDIEDFIARKDPVFSERDLLGFSRLHRVHPGLVAGQIQRRTERYDLFRKHLVKVRSILSPTAMVDGWGDVAPALG